MNATKRAAVLVATLLLTAGVLSAAVPPPTQGALEAIGPDGKPLGACPLKHTDVKVSLSGNLCYVVVTQEFTNPFKDKIEAVYIFPLSADAAVSEMMMTVGDRIIVGKIKPREEARRIYEEAKRRGHVASLLDQERPNIFTQSVANIEPGKTVKVTIGYVETLKYEDGVYSFAFPMVVGPRYIPGPPVPSPGKPVPMPRPLPLKAAPVGAPALKADAAKPKGGPAIAPPPPPKDPARDVPDADKIRPPITPEGTRAGHDISITVYLDAGSKVTVLKSRQHEIDTKWTDDAHTRATVSLAAKKEIPNKDFVLEYSTAVEDIADAVLTYTDKRGGFFTLLLQPPKRVRPEMIRARELIFVIDTSGSMRGFPIDTAKAVMSRCIKNLRANDKLNLITFAGNTTMLWEKPVDNTEANRAKALEFLTNLRGGGGTEMMKAIRACLEGEKDPERVRIVCFMTDGYVGNDMAIIDAIKKNVETSRVFSFGIGRSVNRYLLDKMARFGRGEVEYVYSDKTAEASAKKFYDRIDAPVLTDIEIDWGALSAYVESDDVYPHNIPDLFSVKPVVLKGKFKRPDKDLAGEITIRGRTAAGKFERTVRLLLPADGAGNKALASMWARAKVGELMSEMLTAVQRGKPDPKLKEQVVALGLEYTLMTQYTSFVAVEEKTVTIGGEPRRVDVPVEMPEGVSYEGIFGKDGEGRRGWVGWVGGEAMMRGPQMMRAGNTSGRIRGRANAQAQAIIRHARAQAAVVSGRDTFRFGFEALEDDSSARKRPVDLVKNVKEDDKLTDEQKHIKVAEIKLAKALQGLEAKLDKDGNYSKGKIVVKGGKIEVAVYLTKWDDATLAALKKLGFVKLLESEPVKMVIGTIEVKKLGELAWLDVVRLVDLPSFSK